MSTQTEPAAADPIPPDVLPARQEHASPEVRSAIDAAVEGALAMPGAPGRDEFLTLAAQARMLSLSGGAPKLIREDPYLAFHVVLVGRDLGISPSAAIELIDVIPPSGDRGPQLSLSPQLLNGQIRRLGLGSIVKAVSDDLRCVAVALEPGGRLDWRCKRTWPEHLTDAEGRIVCTCRGIMGDVEWTWADAQTAGLADLRCAPGAHWKPDSGDARCRCRQGYKTYPKRMHWWRASGYAADDYFPEAGLGLYTAEELGALTDDEGRAIDVSNVELPPGYEVKAPPPPAQADPDAVVDLQVRIHALPEDQRAELRKRWAERVTYSSGKPVPPFDLSAEGLRMANALVSGAEAAARATKTWDQAKANEAVRGALCAAVASLLAGPLALAPAPDPPRPGAPEPPPGAKVDAPQPPDTDDFGSIDGATPEDVDAAIAAVKEITKVHDVDKELTARRLHTEGDANARRRRLAAALVREAVAARAETGDGGD